MHRMNRAVFWLRLFNKAPMDTLNCDPAVALFFRWALLGFPAREQHMVKYSSCKSTQRRICFKLQNGLGINAYRSCHPLSANSGRVYPFKVKSVSERFLRCYGLSDRDNFKPPKLPARKIVPYDGHSNQRLMKAC